MARQEANEAFAATSFLDAGNAAYVEDLQARYQENPAALSPEWQAFFRQLGDVPADVTANARGAPWQRSDWPIQANGELVAALDGNWLPAQIRVTDKIRGKAQAAGADISSASVEQAARDSVRAIMMIRAFRMRGHLAADLDPLHLEPVAMPPELDPASYGFGPEDLDRKIFIDHVLGLEFATVNEMLEILRRTYCGTLGIEFMHISDPAEKAWIQERIEGPDKGIAFTPEGKKAILNKLVEADGFERFCDVKFTGTKRFGLDGGESLIPALEQIIKRGGNLGVAEIVLGMAHRGRLNVLAQVLGKPHRAIFNEFKGGSAKPDDVEGSGDVKYHLGASADREFDGNKVHLSLTANPSHLEIVDPVVLGKARAKQDLHADQPRGDIVPLDQRARVLPLLIHGDAAFAGQGVVAECFSLSGVRGHRTSGSIHFIINNQIGFTTNPRFARSSPYPSDLAKMVETPIFHANGDDPEAVVYAAKIATEFRQKFHKPVVIDMFCYRRFGHNEGDEPAFTQPLMYKRIREHPSTLTLYGERLVGEGLLSADEVEKLKGDWRAKLDAELEISQNYRPNKADWLDGVWTGLKEAETSDDPRRGETGVALDSIESAGGAAHLDPRWLPPSQDDPAVPGQPKDRDRHRRRHRLGDRRGAGLRLRSSRTGTTSGCRARTWSAAPSRSAIRCCSIRKPRNATSRSTRSPMGMHGLRS